jgi:uncharacterized protein YbjT (DUF2867 family)
MKKAILFGASGLVGSHLLDILLNNPDYEQVTIVVRKNLNINHPKLKTLIGDYHSLPNLKEDIEADEVFIALGTTKNKTPNQKEYYQVDHDYPVLAAKIAKEKGAKSVFLVSAVGANANSKVFYIRTKGETERDIITLDLDHTHIFRPSMILGNRKENRPLEKIFAKVWPVISPVFKGKLSIYRGIDAREIAQSMINAAKGQKGKVNIYHWREMKGQQ